MNNKSYLEKINGLKKTELLKLRKKDLKKNINI